MAKNGRYTATSSRATQRGWSTAKSASITVKRVPGGRVSSWLHDHLGVGDHGCVAGRLLEQGELPEHVAGDEAHQDQ